MYIDIKYIQIFYTINQIMHIMYICISKIKKWYDDSYSDINVLYIIYIIYYIIYYIIFIYNI